MTDTLVTLAQALALPLSEQQRDRLERYLALLLRWNAVYNLTAVRDPAQMLTQHLADCLAVVEPLRRRCPTGRVLDVGSGGGLPGVVLAVMQPEWQVTCIDTVGKKAAFVRQVAASLALPNLSAIHGRVESDAPSGHDLVTSRAFASLGDFVRLSRAALQPGGLWAAMKGKRPLDEEAALPPDVEVFHVEPVPVPGMDAERCLVWMRCR